MTDNRTTSGDTCAVTRPAFTDAAPLDRNIFAYDTAAPLNLTKHVEAVNNGIEISSIEYDSPGEGRVTGMLYVPVTRSSLRPGLIVQHGMPGSARGQASALQMFAEHGAVVIAIDAPFARRTGSPVRFTPADRMEQIQLIQDLQRAVDILRAQVNVDPNRIAYRGWSYGGAMGALFVGVERRLKTAILTVPDGGLISHFTGSDDRPGPLGQLTCANRNGWVRMMTPIEPIRFIGLAAPMPLLIQSGRADALIPNPDAEAVHNAAAQPRTIRWYEAGHGLNAAAITDQLNWLREHIGTDAPQ